jgi:hypothetical protein
MHDPIEKLSDFSLILVMLCGDRSRPYEHRVVELLQAHRGADADPQGKLNPRYREKNLLQVLLLKFEQATNAISHPNPEMSSLSDIDFLQYINICILIGKIITHNPIYYEELNAEFIHCVLDTNASSLGGGGDQRFSLRGRQSLHNYETNEPVLYLLIKALHSLFR